MTTQGLTDHTFLAQRFSVLLLILRFLGAEADLTESENAGSGSSGSVAPSSSRHFRRSACSK